MEPVTHFLTGAVLARAGFNRKAAYATLAMTLAAEAPDVDYIYRLGGPLPWFEHHRGWTHAFWGLPIEAAAIVGLCWLIHRWRARRGGTTIAPVRWGLLSLFALLALLSHILLDFTNNYGVRPMAPLDPRWYDLSLVFIAEPLLWLALLGALAAPWIFGLVSSEVGAREKPFQGRGWALAALVFMVGLWGLRWYERGRAIEIARANEISSDPVLRVAADPYPVTPFQWQVIVETPMYFRVGVVDTLKGEMLSDSVTDVIHKPPTTLATLVAKRSWLGRIYLDWSKYPVVQEAAQAQGAEAGSPLREVTFTDLRFRYASDVLGSYAAELLGERMRHPLLGIVYVNEDSKVERMSIQGEDQK